MHVGALMSSLRVDPWTGGGGGVDDLLPSDGFYDLWLQQCMEGNCISSINEAKTTNPRS